MITMKKSFKGIYESRTYLFEIKIIIAQGYNARKVNSEVYASLYCSALSLGGNVNIRRMSKPNIGSIFHIKINENILVKGNYYVIYQNCQNLMLLTFSDTKRTPMHLFLFTIPSREN